MLREDGENVDDFIFDPLDFYNSTWSHTQDLLQEIRFEMWHNLDARR